MTLADQVAEAINVAAAAEAWPVRVEAIRRTFPIVSIEDLKTTRLSVFDGPKSSLAGARVGWLHTVTVYVVIQRKLSAGEAEDTAAIDGLADLLNRIELLCEADGGVVIDDWTFRAFDESTERLAFSPLLLRDESTYAAVVGLEFTD